MGEHIRVTLASSQQAEQHPTSFNNTCVTAVTEERESAMQFPYWREAPPCIDEALHDRNYESLIFIMTMYLRHERRQHSTVKNCLNAEDAYESASKQ
jgi:hypothetical protein